MKLTEQENNALNALSTIYNNTGLPEYGVAILLLRRMAGAIEEGSAEHEAYIRQACLGYAVTLSNVMTDPQNVLDKARAFSDYVLGCRTP